MHARGFWLGNGYPELNADRDEVLSVTNPDGKQVVYTYDDAGRRETMTDPDDGVFTYMHDAAGRLSVFVPRDDLAAKKSFILFPYVAR